MYDRQSIYLSLFHIALCVSSVFIYGAHFSRCRKFVGSQIPSGMKMVLDKSCALFSYESIVWRFMCDVEGENDDTWIASNFETLFMSCVLIVRAI